MPAHTHTHDGIDWVARLADLRVADAANGPAQRAVAERLVASLPASRPTVLDVGSGAGGMSAALAEALAAKSGGTLVLIDAVPELLAAASGAAGSAPGAAGVVEVQAIQADLATVAGQPDTEHDDRRSGDGHDPSHHAAAGGAISGAPDVPAADLVWASNVTHHLPDQRRAVGALVGWLAPGGCLALAEGGLSMRCLPWDVGVGVPGLQDRLIAAQGTWFRAMRTEMAGAVRLPVGWNLVLGDAGLADVTSFSYLVDVPAPLTDSGRAAVISWLDWMGRATSELLDRDDLATIARLLDPDDIAYVGRRDDVFLLKVSTVYLGWRR